MEAVIFFIFFGLYIAIRVMIGGGESAWEKQKIQAQDGLYLFNNKDFNGAKNYFEHALKKKPFESVNYVILGEIALHEKEYEKALFLGQKALRLDNTVPESHLIISKGLYFLHEFNESFANGKRAVWFGRKHIEANRWYGKLLIEKGEIKKGVFHLEIAFSNGDEDAGHEIRSAKSKK